MTSAEGERGDALETQAVVFTKVESAEILEETRGLVAIPVHNEQENLGDVIRELRSTFPPAVSSSSTMDLPTSRSAFSVSRGLPT